MFYIVCIYVYLGVPVSLLRMSGGGGVPAAVPICQASRPTTTIIHHQTPTYIIYLLFSFFSYFLFTYILLYVRHPPSYKSSSMMMIHDDDLSCIFVSFFISPTYKHILIIYFSVYVYLKISQVSWSAQS